MGFMVLQIWHKLALQAKVICLFTFANLLIVSVYTVAAIKTQTASELEMMDSQMVVAAKSYARVVGEKNIDLAVSGNNIPEDEYIALVASMGRYAEEVGLEYIYSMVVVDSKVKYVIDGSSQSEIDEGDFSFPLDDYEDADAKLVEAWNDWTPKVVEYQDTFGQHRSYFLPVATSVGNKILVGVDTDISEVRNNIRDVLMTQVYIGIGILTFGFLITFPFARIITKAMTNISAGIKQVAENRDFTHEIMISAKDEIGDIAENINMLQNLIKQTIGRAYSMSSESLSQAEHFITSADSIHAQVASATDQAQHISDQAQLAAKNTTSIQTRTEEINRQLSDSRIAIKELAEGVNKTAQNNRILANELQALTKEVGAVKVVLNTVAEISDQTNLLSINASIEAAHAGKLGAGFAVVADEVRSLANKTQQTVSESEEVIKMISVSVDEVVNRMVEIVDINEKLAQTSTSSLANIESIYERFTHITSSAAESAASSNDIRESILDISDSLKEINAKMEASEMQVNEIVGKASSIRDDARKIKDYLSGFKIN